MDYNQTHNITYIYTMYFSIGLSHFNKLYNISMHIWEFSLILLIYSRFGGNQFFEREIIDIATKRKLATLLNRGLVVKLAKGYSLNPLYLAEITQQNNYIYNRFLTPKYNKFLTSDNQ